MIVWRGISSTKNTMVATSSENGILLDRLLVSCWFFSQNPKGLDQLIDYFRLKIDFFFVCLSIYFIERQTDGCIWFVDVESLIGEIGRQGGQQKTEGQLFL